MLNPNIVYHTPNENLFYFKHLEFIMMDRLLSCNDNRDWFCKIKSVWYIISNCNPFIKYEFARIANYNQLLPFEPSSKFRWLKKTKWTCQNSEKEMEEYISKYWWIKRNLHKWPRRYIILTELKDINKENWRT
jgi:hypothetical protein